MVETKTKRKTRKKKEKQHEGVCHITAKRASVSLRTFQWAAIIDNNIIGFYRTPEEASKARSEILAGGNEKENSN